MPEPTFRRDEDGKHVLWFHDCFTYLGGDDPTTLTPHRAETRLPISDNGWQVSQTDPLTVMPSILCGRCKIHGFINGGKWVGV